MSDSDNARGNSPQESDSNASDLSTLRGPLTVVAAGTVVAFLYAARVILVPVVLAIFLAYVLNPLVQQLQRIRIPGTELRMPRFLSVSAVVVFAVVIFGALSVVLAGQVRQLGARVPHYAKRIAQDIGAVQKKLKKIEKYFDRAVQPIRPEPAGERGEKPRDTPNPSELEDSVRSTLTEAAPSRQTDESGVRRGSRNRPIVIDSGRSLWFRLSPYVTGGLTGLAGFAVQALTLVFVLFFVLLQAPAFKEKLLTIGGTTEAKREAILGALNDINQDVQGYLLGRTIINVGLAVVLAVTFFIYGLNYALLLGILGGLLNFIPYFGAVVGMLVAAAVAYMQFGVLSAVVATVVIYFILTSIEGNLITPITLSRQLQLNSLAVLLGLIFWGWLWGPIGMLLAIPILAVIRVVAEHVDDLAPVAELLRG